MQLNAYTQGDFFAAHTDSPRGSNVLGSLVVCLPSAHTCGCLVVRHHTQEVLHAVVTSSSSLLPPRTALTLDSCCVCLPVVLVQAQECTCTRVKPQPAMQTCYDWGAQLEEHPTAVHWAFHFLDVEHEVDPVSSGCRLTLTYTVSPGFTSAALELQLCMVSLPASRHPGACCIPLHAVVDQA